MIANYHTHTWRCRHADGTEREYVERAIEGGLKILGFSDHSPYPFPDGYDSGMRMRLDHGRDRQPFGAQQPPDRSGYHIRADGWICAWPAGYAADLTVVDNDFRKLHNCAIQRKSYHRFMVSIGNFRGIALFLHLAIVQFAKKCYPYKRNVLAEGTKCHRCDWTNCCPT